MIRRHYKRSGAEEERRIPLVRPTEAIGLVPPTFGPDDLLDFRVAFFVFFFVAFFVGIVSSVSYYRDNSPGSPMPPEEAFFDLTKLL